MNRSTTHPEGLDLARLLGSVQILDVAPFPRFPMLDPVLAHYREMDTKECVGERWN